jgi:hypothetical protein
MLADVLDLGELDFSDDPSVCARVGERDAESKAVIRWNQVHPATGPQFRSDRLDVDPDLSAPQGGRVQSRQRRGQRSGGDQDRDSLHGGEPTLGRKMRQSCASRRHCQA